MKVIKSTHRHKLNKEFPLIAEFKAGMDETLEFGLMCRAFENRFGPSAVNDWNEPTRFNTNWRKEIRVKAKRRRIYFKNIKDWQWAILSK